MPRWFSCGHPTPQRGFQNHLSKQHLQSIGDGRPDCAELSRARVELIDSPIHKTALEIRGTMKCSRAAGEQRHLLLMKIRSSPMPAVLSKYKFGSKAYSTWYSQADSHPGTNQALCRVASEIRRDRAFSAWLSKYKFGSKAYSTWYSQAVSNPGTNQAFCRYASEIRRDRAFSARYDRKCQPSFSTNSLRLSKYKFDSKAYSTWYSQADSHPGTNQALCHVASEIRRDWAFSARYDRKCLPSFSTNSLRLSKYKFGSKAYSTWYSQADSLPGCQNTSSAQNLTTPGIPRQTPIQVLTRPYAAKLPRSDEIGRSQHGCQNTSSAQNITTPGIPKQTPIQELTRPYAAELLRSDEIGRSQHVQLDFRADFTVTQTPSAFTVKEGDSVTITCCWNKTITGAKVKWYRDGQHAAVIRSNKHIQTEVKNNCSSLFIGSISRNDTVSYICEVTQDIPYLARVNGTRTTVDIPAEKGYLHVCVIPVILYVNQGQESDCEAYRPDLLQYGERFH
ncbi:hypothetical protein NFI96_001967 [Prochilodus magdalenae]|nr:hypothetical protein NFI96_001967 [Prochilodus magdalenae]